jgi:predicted RNase H-like HicB family nuclease
MTASEIPSIVHLTYEFEDGSWSAESEQMPSLFAGGDSLDEAKALARQAIRDEFGEGVTIFDWLPVPAELEPTVASKGANQSVQTPMMGWPDSASPAHEWSLPQAVS